MPYDSLVNHYMLGGRAAWHFSDHYGWEIIDTSVVFPTITGYSRDTVSKQNISNLQNRISMAFSLLNSKKVSHYL
jgi:hypothetical protein